MAGRSQNHPPDQIGGQVSPHPPDQGMKSGELFLWVELELWPSWWAVVVTATEYSSVVQEWDKVVEWLWFLMD